MLSYNFCWPVCTLRLKNLFGEYAKQTPAMAAGLANHVWTLSMEWASHPARKVSLVLKRGSKADSLKTRCT
jgi:hypothetical protein